MPEIKPFWHNFIAGKWVEGASGRRIVVENPATGAPLAEIARAETADVDRAVEAALSCVRSGALTNVRPANRGRILIEIGRILRSRLEPIAHIVCLDAGKSITQARWEVEGAARYFEYYGGLADKIEGRYIPLGANYVDYVIPTPFGVSAQIIPWNFPIEMAARSVAPALAAGNAVVLKSSELDPLSVCVLAEVCQEAGLPDGALNVICGYGNEAGAALALHKKVNQIVFTGSVATGQSILHAAAQNIVPCVVELGGKSAGIVFSDADLNAVLESTRWGTFFNCGQVCSAMSRLLVEHTLYKEVTDRVAAMISEFSMGPGIDDNFITPLISGAQLDRVEGLCLTTAQQGNQPLLGGRRREGTGYFMNPTLFAGLDPSTKIAREEVFGPVLCIMPFRDEDEAVRIANETDYGLVAGVFTSDLDRATGVAERLEAGQVFVNEWFAGGVETPFGGMKKSGFGREKGQEALANYYQSKNVAIRRLKSRIENPRTL